MIARFFVIALVGCGGATTGGDAREPLPTGPDPLDAVELDAKTFGSSFRTGDKLVIPDPDDMTKLSQHGGGTANGMYRVCVDPAGVPVTTRVVGSSGLPNYDRRVLRRIATFRYEPHVVDGKAVPVCSVIRFIYRQNG